MIKVEIAAVVQCPIEDVFARITDLSGYSRWASKSSSLRGTELLSKGPVGLSTTYLDHTSFGTFRGRVIEFEKPVKVVFRQRLTWLKIPVLENWTFYALEKGENGTIVNHRSEGKLFGLFILAQPVAAGIIHQERERVISSLKQSLEK
jgi:uncharacterized protein YndB with AHSA1/START domain